MIFALISLRWYWVELVLVALALWFLWKHGEVIFRTSMTEDDASTIYNPARLLGSLVIVIFLFLFGWDVIVSKHAFSPVSFGAGIAAVIAAVGTWIIMHKRTDT